MFLNTRSKKRVGEKITDYRSALFKKDFLPTCKPFPSVIDLFETLRRRYVRIALGSSGKRTKSRCIPTS